MTTTECNNADGICQFCADYVPPQLPHPQGALEVGEWRNTDRSDETIPPFRDLIGRAWTVEAAHETCSGWTLGHGDTMVRTEGVQFETGTVRWWVAITGETDLLPVSSIAQLADALTAARNEIVRLNAADVFAPVFSEVGR
ncbi:hypothetical protein [Mycolicibacterium fortuitum]|uniref:hypothetical protein n=1 Tax=Mycolicibacterium fortuitum TaxID=1766 RepID=UPI00149017E2|nr:hypothetical protein [Mycolicibacterium fortuitum]